MTGGAALPEPCWDVPGCIFSSFGLGGELRKKRWRNPRSGVEEGLSHVSICCSLDVKHERILVPAMQVSGRYLSSVGDSKGAVAVCQAGMDGGAGQGG